MEGFNDVVLKAAHLSPSGQLTVKPSYDTTYTLTVTSSRGSDSKSKLVKLHAATQPSGAVFYFRMTNRNSQVLPCFAIAVYADTEAHAKAIALDQWGGYMAEDIDAAAFASAC